MTMSTIKRKKVSKKNKKSWRKHTDIKDVDNFLEDLRLEERLGKRLDSELFKIDTFSSNKKANVLITTSEKKKRALEPPRCFKALEPTTAIPDPITKRNRVKSEEERKSINYKFIEAKNKINGVFTKKYHIAGKDKIIQKKRIPKRGDFNRDLWEENTEEKCLKKVCEWMTDEGVQHILTNVGKFKVRHPRTFMREPKKYKSSLPSTEVPHPGISYNPSYTDHQNLLNEVAEKEIKQLKEEEHLKRTTTDLFSKVTADEKIDTWLTEMSSCLQPNDADADDQDIDGDYRAINPPTSFDKKKTLKQRRKLKESKALELQRKMLQIEKKKVSDLYKLKLLTQELDKKDQKSARLQENRARRKMSMVNRTKRLNRNKFEEPDLVFKRKHEITGNLRSLEPEGNILLDRFYSMQRRNILPPTVKQNKTKKAKVKRYIKPGFRIDAAV